MLYQFSKLIFLLSIAFFMSDITFAVTPNPGHPWSEVGDGTFAVTGPTVARTYAFPDANSTILTSNSAVTVAQGGSGATTLTGILKGNGTSAFTTVTAPSGALVGDTDTQTLTNKTISAASNTLTGVAGSGANSDITSLSALSTPLSVAQGGTGAATLTADNLLVGNGTSAMAFLAPGTTGNYVKADGTNWVSQTAPTATTDNTMRTILATAAISNASITSLTSRDVGLSLVPFRITVNQISYSVNSQATAGTVKLCVYTEDGATKVIDETTAAPSVGINTHVLSSPVTLDPGNYYFVVGCATTCSNSIGHTTETATSFVNGAAVPSGKLVYTGTVTHTSGTCNSSLGTVTGTVNKLPLLRLD